MEGIGNIGRALTTTGANACARRDVTTDHAGTEQLLMHSEGVLIVVQRLRGDGSSTHSSVMVSHVRDVFDGVCRFIRIEISTSFAQIRDDILIIRNLKHLGRVEDVSMSGIIVVQVQSDDKPAGSQAHEERLHVGDVFVSRTLVDGSDDEWETSQSNVLHSSDETVSETNELGIDNERNGGPQDSGEARVGKPLANERTNRINVCESEETVDNDQSHRRERRNDGTHSITIHDTTKQRTLHEHERRIGRRERREDSPGMQR